MAQRVLAENAGVESVRYVLPNKHYIPVDMKYIGVDNTTPCVLLFGIQFGAILFLIVFGDYSICGRRHLPRVCGAEDDWGATGIGSFLDRCPLPVIADLLRRERVVN
jgi:hypothetical protein